MPGDQVAVGNGIGREGGRHREVGVGQGAGHILNTVGLDLHAYGLIGKILFAVGKAGPTFAIDDQLAIALLGAQQQRRRMADGGGWLTRFVEICKELFKISVAPEGVHGALSTDQEDGDIVVWIDFG